MTQRPINPHISLYLLGSGILLVTLAVLGFVFGESLDTAVKMIFPFLLGIGVGEIIAGVALLRKITTDADVRRRMEREGRI